MKFKFNFKLTAFLVSLFLSLIILILGNKNQYCLCFGFILLGLSAALFVYYNNDKTTQTIEEINKEVDELDEEFAQFEDNEEIQEERAYALQQLYLRQNRLMKRKRKVSVTFYLCAGLLILLGIIGFF